MLFRWVWRLQGWLQRLAARTALLAIAGGVAFAADQPAPAPAPAPELDPMAPPAETAEAGSGATVIVVQGRRRVLVADPENPSRFATQIDLTHATESLTTIADELEKTVGVSVRRLGGLGSFSTVSIRGSTAQQVEIFWDGIPLNRADAGLTNLEEIPVDLLARIEIYRGVAPAQFGAAGIGGVINLVPRRVGAAGAAGPAAEGGPGAWIGPEHGLLSVTGGSFDTYKFNVMASGRTDDGFDLLAFYHRLQSRGNFQYDNDNGTPLNPNDDREETRVNNDFVAQDFFLRLEHALPADWRCTVLADGFDKRQGLPGLNAVQARASRLRTGRGIAAVKLEGPRPTGAGAASLPSTGFGINAVYEEVEFFDPQAELNFAATEDLTVTYGLAATAQTGFVLWPERLILSLYGEARHEETQTTYHLPTIAHSPIQRRERGTAVAQSELALFDGQIRVIPTVRGELLLNRLAGDPKVIAPSQRGENRSTLVLLSPSLGAVYAPMPAIEFRANLGRFHRVPTLFELFGNRGGVVGAPDLAPEQADVFDIGFQARPPLPAGWGRWEIEYVLFYSYTRDLIALVRNSQNTSKATNIGAAKNLGHEFTLHWDMDGSELGVWPSLQFNYTHQDPRDASNTPFLDGNYLPNQSVDAWFLRVELAHEFRQWMTETRRGAYVAAGRPMPKVRNSAWIECAYSGETFHDRANLYLVEARTLVNVGVSANFFQPDRRAATTISIEVKNLFDDRVTDVARYPLPGRSWYVTGQMQF